MSVQLTAPATTETVKKKITHLKSSSPHIQILPGNTYFQVYLWWGLEKWDEWVSSSCPLLSFPPTNTGNNARDNSQALQIYIGNSLHGQHNKTIKTSHPFYFLPSPHVYYHAHAWLKSNIWLVRFNAVHTGRLICRLLWCTRVQLRAISQYIWR